MSGDYRVGHHAHQAPVLIDDRNLIEVIGEHQCGSNHQWCGTVHLQWRQGDGLGNWYGFHPVEFTIDAVASNEFQHVDSMHSSNE